MNRHGFDEECFFSFSYSPCGGEDGPVEGVVDIAFDTTTQIVDRRRLALLASLNAELVAEFASPADMFAVALPLLRAHDSDFSAVEIYPPPRSAAPEGGLPSDPPADLGGHVQLQRTGQGTVAWQCIGGPDSSVSTNRAAVLALRFGEHIPIDDACSEFAALIGSSLTRALGDNLARQAERRVAEGQRDIAETLQRSLLTAPLRIDGVQLAVRYESAAEHARVGGDWYDSFRNGDGIANLVVGDVSGHDFTASAGMGQLRNLLRGVAATVDTGPADVLATLDRVMKQLGTSILATAVVAWLGPPDAVGTFPLRWSNAGHLPPVLVTAHGGVRLLSTPPDVMLGADPTSSRTAHEIALEAGDTVVFYSDGLIERRGQHLDDSLAALTAALTGGDCSDPERVCDHLLATFDDHDDDDVVLLVLTVLPPGR